MEVQMDLPLVSYLAWVLDFYCDALNVLCSLVNMLRISG